MTDHSPKTPSYGTYREVDRSRVEFSDALETWIGLAYDALILTASSYHAVISYGELAQKVQEASGVRTKMLLANWIGRLLERVAQEAKRVGDPPLTSLCVHQDGTIGEGYVNAPKSVDDSPGDDVELYAANHRLLCYRKYARDLPSDGGSPALTSVESERRRVAARHAKRAEPPNLCRRCSTVLPVSGRCDYCD